MSIGKLRQPTTVAAFIPLLCSVIIATSPKPARCAAVSWTSDAAGSWSAAANWNSYPNLPAASDDVTIDDPNAEITVTHSTGSDSINSLSSNESLIVSGGTLSLASGSSVNAALTINGGTLNVNGDAGLTVSGAATISDGVLGGSGAVAFHDLRWTGGWLSGSGVKQIAAGGTLVIDGGLKKYLQSTINNSGSAVLSGGGVIENRAAGVVFNNLAGATLDIQSDASFTGSYLGYDATGTFNNYGSLTKSAGTGTTAFDWYWTVNNTGSVQVQKGSLSFAGSFNNSGTADVATGAALVLSGGGASSGQFSVASGASLSFNGGYHDLSGANIANQGVVYFSGGAVNFNNPITLSGSLYFSGSIVNINAALTAATASLSSGALGGSGNISLHDLHWSGGSLSGSGVKAIPAGGTLTIDGSSKKYLQGSINNGGTATLSGAGSIENRDSGVLFNNLAGATLDIQSDASLTGTYVGYDATGTFRNYGLLTKSAGTGTTAFDWYWTVNNPGTIHVQSGILKFSGFVTQLSGNTLTGGTWIIDSQAALVLSLGANIAVNKADVTLDGEGSLFSKIDSLADNQGHFAINGGRDFTTSGDLENSGAVSVGSGSSLSVTGALHGTGDVIVDGLLVADAVIQDTITLGPGATLTIRAITNLPASKEERPIVVPEAATLTLLLTGAGVALPWLIRRRRKPLHSARS